MSHSHPVELPVELTAELTPADEAGLGYATWLGRRDSDLNGKSCRVLARQCAIWPHSLAYAAGWNGGVFLELREYRSTPGCDEAAPLGLWRSHAGWRGADSRLARVEFIRFVVVGVASRVRTRLAEFPLTLALSPKGVPLEERGVLFDSDHGLRLSPSPVATPPRPCRGEMRRRLL
jgi:hypothetical protein